jgi:uncharacterized protein YdaU (DUF1376 family)
MAKDPAFLFYSSDFLTGTMFMSNEQIGKYIRLLCAQHQMGALTEQHMLNICHTYDKDIWAKFTKQDDGTFINKRLHDETQKRKNFCESRRNNRNSKPKDKQVNNHMSPHMSIHMSSHMENENENENENRNESKKVVRTKFVIPEPMQILEYMTELNEKSNKRWTEGMIRMEAQKFFNYYESNGWRVGKNPMRNWKASASNWMNNANPIKQNNNEQRIAEHIAKHSDNPHYLNLFPNLNKATTTH